MRNHIQQVHFVSIPTEHLWQTDSDLNTDC